MAGFTLLLGVVSGNNSTSVSSPVWTTVSQPDGEPEPSESEGGGGGALVRLCLVG